MPTSNSWLDTTLALMEKAKERRVTHLQMYKATQLSPHWLSELANGKIANPSIHRVQRLHDYLTRLVA